jgi:hypothetical protein
MFGRRPTTSVCCVASSKRHHFLHRMYGEAEIAEQNQFFCSQHQPLIPPDHFFPHLHPKAFCLSFNIFVAYFENEEDRG